MTNTEPASSTSSARGRCSTRKLSAFPLFKLSGELRNAIHGYITDEIAGETERVPIPLKSCVFNYIVDTHDGSHIALRTNSITTVFREFSALSQASSQLRQEIWSFLWSRIRFEICDCHPSEWCPDSLFGHFFDPLPPMITGPRSLGCGRVSKLSFVAEHDDAYLSAAFSVAQQVAAFLEKLEFSGCMEIRGGRPIASWFWSLVPQFKKYLPDNQGTSQQQKDSPKLEKRGHRGET